MKVFVDEDEREIGRGVVVAVIAGEGWIWRERAERGAVLVVVSCRCRRRLVVFTAVGSWSPAMLDVIR